VSALRTPERKALTFEGVSWTYAELQQRIDRLAALLRSRGVQRGDRIGFLGHNQPAFFETLFAAWLLAPTTAIPPVPLRPSMSFTRDTAP